MRSSIFTHGGLISRLDYWIFLFLSPGVIDYKHLRDGLYIGSGMNGHMKAMRDIYRYYYYVLSGRGRQARCMEHSDLGFLCITSIVFLGGVKSTSPVASRSSSSKATFAHT